VSNSSSVRPPGLIIASARRISTSGPFPRAAAARPAPAPLAHQTTARLRNPAIGERRRQHHGVFLGWSFRPFRPGLAASNSRKIHQSPTGVPSNRRTCSDPVRATCASESSAGCRRHIIADAGSVDGSFGRVGAGTPVAGFSSRRDFDHRQGQHRRNHRHRRDGGIILLHA